MDRDKLFELYKLFITERRKPNSVNGNQDYMQLALSDATRALSVFDERMHDLDMDLNRIREELTV